MLRSFASAVVAALLASCGAAPAARETLPECAGDGEAGAVGAAMRAFLGWTDGPALADSDALYNEAVTCRIRRDGGPLTVAPEVNASSRREPFALSCWVRGGPADGQCQAFGRARGVAPDVPPAPASGSFDFERSWLLRMQSFEGDAIVVVTIGWTAQGYQAVVARRDGRWEVVELDIAWTT